MPLTSALDLDGTPEAALRTLAIGKRTPEEALVPVFLGRPVWDWSQLNMPGEPLLHATLDAIATHAPTRHAAPHWHFPQTLSEAWPIPKSAGPFDAPSGRERLAGVLIAAGQDPWLVDGRGDDAWDYAVAAQARSVLVQLWGHPQRPSAESLLARQYTHGDGRLPGLHLAVHQSNPRLAELWLQWGHAPDARDERGYVALAWARDAELLPQWDALGLVPNALEPLRQVRAHWALQIKADRRLMGTFPRAELEGELERLRPVGRSAEEQADWAAVIQDWLGQKLGQSYQVPSVLTKHVRRQESNFEIGSGDYHFVQEKGVTKGSWSLVTALAWVELRARYKDSLLQSNMWGSWFRGYTPEQQAALRQEHIREGLPARGLLALTAWSSHAFDLLLTPMADLQEERWATLCDAMDASRHLAPSPSSKMSEALGFQWDQVRHALTSRSNLRKGGDLETGGLGLLLLEHATEVREWLDTPTIQWSEAWIIGFTQAMSHGAQAAATAAERAAFADHLRWACNRAEGTTYESGQDDTRLTAVRRVLAFEGWLAWAQEQPTTVEPLNPPLSRDEQRLLSSIHQQEVGDLAIGVAADHWEQRYAQALRQQAALHLSQTLEAQLDAPRPSTRPRL